MQVIRCLLIAPFPDPFLNNDAGKLFLERYDEYVRKAMQWTTDYAIQDNTAGLGAAIVQVDPESDAGEVASFGVFLSNCPHACSTVCNFPAFICRHTLSVDGLHQSRDRGHRGSYDPLSMQGK